MTALLLTAVFAYLAGVATCIWASFRLAAGQRRDAERMRARANMTLSHLHEVVETVTRAADRASEDETDDLPVQ